MLQSKLINSLTLLISMLVAVGCASTTQVQFDVAEDVQVSIVDPTQPNAVGETLNRPYQVTKDQLNNRALRFAAKGRVPQYWIFTEWTADSVRLAPTLQPAPFRDPPPGGQPQPTNQSGGQGQGQQGQNGVANVTHRVLMQGYRALLAGDYTVAQEAAGNLEKLAPKLAAPQILKGLVAMQQGDNGTARAALQLARTLDPEDKEIDTLLELVQ